MNETQIRETAEAVLGDSKQLDVELFESGAVSIVVRSGVHTAVIDGGPADEWGVSIDPSAEHAFTGHDQVVASLKDALMIVQQGMCSGARSCV